MRKLLHSVQLAVLLLFLFNCSCSLTPSGSVLVFGKPTSPVNGAINVIYLSTFERAAVAYQLQDPSFDQIVFTQVSGMNASTAAVVQKKYDFSVIASVLPSDAQALVPTIQAYPIMMSAYAPFYNLPASVGTAPLILTMLAACEIWRGNITMWDDPRLIATNPSLTLPNVPIQVVMNGFANDAHKSVSCMCSKVDPIWAATIGISALPPIPEPYISIPVSASSPGGASYVVDHPYTFGWNSMAVVPTVTAVKIASLINQAGKVVSPTPATISQNFLEMAVQGLQPMLNSFDLTNPQSAYAWPVCMTAWLMIDTVSTLTTCASKKSVLNFLLWMYESSVAADLALSQGVNVVPSLYVQQTGLITRLRKEIQCDGSPLVPIDTTSAFIQGNPLMTRGLGLITELYEEIDTTYHYSFTPDVDSLVLDRVASGEIDFGLVNTAVLSDADIATFLAPFDRSLTTTSTSGADTPSNDSTQITTGGMIYPAYLTGLTIVYSLPLAVQQLYATSPINLQPLYPLKLDVPTVGLIFSGRIISWLDPAITQFNLQLESWFTQANASTQISIVACCAAGSDDYMIASTLLLQSALLNSTTPSFISPTQFFQSIISSGASTMSLIEAEGRMQTKVITSPGSISYRMISGAATSTTSEFQIVQTNSAGVVETVTPTPSAMKKCALDKATDLNVANYVQNPYQRKWITNSPGCYPLTAMLSIAVASSYTNGDPTDAGDSISTKSVSSGCGRATKNLEFLSWLSSNQVMSTAATSMGLVRLSDIPVIQSYIINDLLNTATCDGQTILITLPVVWSMSKAITIFAYVASLFACGVCVLTIGGLYYYRKRAPIRSAAPLFLAQIALGLIFLSLSVVAWSTPVTTVTCQFYQWLFNLGFTLVFAPLFVKTWRIYCIYTSKHVKIVKIPTSTLLLYVVGMLTFEICVLSIWSAVSPLQPTLYEVSPTSPNAGVNQYTHCSVRHSSGMVFIGIEAVFKGFLLVFGSLMGFATRKVVSTFNNSHSIAWCIYNVVFSSIIVMCIIIFISVLGNTLILLIVFLWLWIAYFTWCLIYIPKIMSILNSDEKIEGLSGGISLVAMSPVSNGAGGNFSFASIVGMPMGQLARYAKALETQLDLVRRRLGVGPVSSLNRVGPKSSFSGGEARILLERLANSSPPHSSPDGSPDRSPRRVHPMNIDEEDEDNSPQTGEMHYKYMRNKGHQRESSDEANHSPHHHPCHSPQSSISLTNVPIMTTARLTRAGSFSGPTNSDGSNVPPPMNLTSITNVLGSPASRPRPRYVSLGIKGKQLTSASNSMSERSHSGRSSPVMLNRSLSREHVSPDGPSRRLQDFDERPNSRSGFHSPPSAVQSLNGSTGRRSPTAQIPLSSTAIIQSSSPSSSSSIPPLRFPSMGGARRSSPTNSPSTLRRQISSPSKVFVDGLVNERSSTSSHTNGDEPIGGRRDSLLSVISKESTSSSPPGSASQSQVTSPATPPPETLHDRSSRSDQSATNPLSPLSANHHLSPERQLQLDRERVESESKRALARAVEQAGGQMLDLSEVKTDLGMASYEPHSHSEIHSDRSRSSLSPRESLFGQFSLAAASSTEFALPENSHSRRISAFDQEVASLNEEIAMNSSRGSLTSSSTSTSSSVIRDDNSHPNPDLITPVPSPPLSPVRSPPFMAPLTITTMTPVQLSLPIPPQTISVSPTALRISQAPKPSSRATVTLSVSPVQDDED